MKNNTNRRKSSLTIGELLMFLAGGMFCLILITTAMMGGLLARYTTENQGTDSARVAKWDVGAMLSPAPAEGKTRSQVDVVCQKKADSTDMENQGIFELTLTSKSEVAVQSKIVVTLTDALPKGVTMVLRNPENEEMVPEESADRKTLTYENAGTFPAGSYTAVYELEFTVDWLDIDFAVADIDGDPEVETINLDFNVDVSMTQID